MKGDMVSYANSLSNHEYERLETVVLDKYPMFREAYWTLVQYNDLIDNIESIDDSDELKIKIIFKDGVDGCHILTRIEESLDESSNVKIKEKKDKFVITISA